MLPLLKSLYCSLLIIFPFIENQIIINYRNKNLINIIKYSFIGAISFAIFSGGFYALFYERIQQLFWGAIFYVLGFAALFFVTKVNEKNIFEIILAFKFNKVSLGLNRDYRENLLIKFRNSLNTYIEQKR